MVPADVPVRVLTPAQRRRAIRMTAIRIGAVVVLSLGVYFLLPFDRASSANVLFLVVGVLSLLAVVNVAQLRAVMRADYPALRGAEALVVALVLLIVAFSAIYVGMSSSDGTAFTDELDHVDSLYFAVTTLATVGYGDIAPLSRPARLVAMVQMVANVIVIGVFIKLVVNAVKSGHQATGPGVAAPPD